MSDQAIINYFKNPQSVHNLTSSRSDTVVNLIEHMQQTAQSPTSMVKLTAVLLARRRLETDMRDGDEESPNSYRIVTSYGMMLARALKSEFITPYKKHMLHMGLYGTCQSLLGSPHIQPMDIVAPYTRLIDVFGGGLGHNWFLTAKRPGWPDSPGLGWPFNNQPQ